MRHCLLIFLAPALLAAADPREAAEFFELKVRPVLAKNCFACHTQTKMGGLDLSSRATVLAGGKRGPAVTPGDPARSLLIQAVHQTGDLKMPPSGKLSAIEIADMSAWIRDGVVWPDAPAPKPSGPGYKITAEHRAWWAFQPVRKPAPPQVKDAAWARTPIDRFVLAAMEAKALKPAPAADRRALIRRVYYDVTGLPPTAGQIEAFLADNSPGAYGKVVDELLKSARYGERWGRYWLDVARYSDDRLNSTQDDPYPNAWRYRDWVIQAFNEDMPYDLFVKAQIAGDLLPDKDRLAAGTGFYALSPEFQDDRVDVTARGFLGLTVACAQCHDHKFDPIPQRDYYALLGVFTNSAPGEFPLAPDSVVKEYKQRREAEEKKQKEIDAFRARQSVEVAGMFAAQAARYLRAVRTGRSDPDLDAETLKRWTEYLRKEPEHPFLKDWQNESFSPEAFQEKLLAVIAEKKRIDDVNHIRLGGSGARSDLANADLISLPRDEYILYRDFASESRPGVLYYLGDKVDRFFSGVWAQHLKLQAEELFALRKQVPPQYAFYHVMKDNAAFRNQKIRIRGAMDNLGEEVPRSFLTILSDGAPKPFEGSGRLDLANAIGAPSNPLTPRVIANRVWMGHFGTPLSGTPSNFGQLGEKPSHPALLDYLAARLIENGWSLKALHREILLSNAYQLSSQRLERNFTADPDNRLFWRANRRRLDIEPLRDTLLAVTGELDTKAGGPPVKLTEPNNNRRTVYGFVSRRKTDPTLSLFDFPNPNSHSEQRIQTASPLQQLYFLNSTFVQDRAKKLAAKAADLGTDDTAGIQAVYRIVFGRMPLKDETAAGLAYLKAEPQDPWVRYAQVLLCSNELLFVN